MPKDKRLETDERELDDTRRRDEEHRVKSEKRRRERESDDEFSSASSSDRYRRKKRKRDKHRRREKDKKKKSRKKKRSHRRRERSSSSSSSGSDSESDASVERDPSSATKNSKLLAKLQARGETLEERKQRRAERSTQKRAAQIAAITGYTADDNPFHDPNLHQPFTWKKKAAAAKPDTAKPSSAAAAAMPKSKQADEKTLHEIEKLRKRRTERELQMEEMDRIKREEARMKELENFDEWARKEEAFHLQQQRQRSAIRLVQGREKPIDILAKNLLLFGLTDEEKSLRGAAVKYQETSNALTELENFQAELEVPFTLLEKLRLEELEEVLKEIDAFLALERQVLDQASAQTSTVLKYWECLRLVTVDEIKIVQTGGSEGSHAEQAREIAKIFANQNNADLVQMQSEIRSKLSLRDDSVDQEYWTSVDEQLTVHLAKNELFSLHQKMLVRQLEKLEQKREELAHEKPSDSGLPPQDESATSSTMGLDEEPRRGVVIPANAVGDEGDLEEELGLTSEVGTKEPESYSWADKYRPRKPRYFNRVKTGYDWNKYNKTHYDRDNPPPKTVQGYKFNIFYPDLIDPSKTPQFVLEQADSPDFCIIRFKAGPPYEDVAFKIVNREWNKSRKHGFRCTFERGVLSLYFNFRQSWYRR